MNILFSEVPMTKKEKTPTLKNLKKYSSKMREEDKANLEMSLKDEA